MIDPILIPISAIVLPIVLVPMILGIRAARHDRELEHAERIKALELGRTLPRDESWWTLPRISVAIGAGVPIAVFFCAWQAGESQSEPALAWVAASIVGLTAVVCGSGLTAWHFFRRDRSVDLRDGASAKSEFDADAYDVVSRRG